jgi:hypothetical protein
MDREQGERDAGYWKNREIVYEYRGSSHDVGDMIMEANDRSARLRSKWPPMPHGHVEQPNAAPIGPTILAVLSGLITTIVLVALSIGPVEQSGALDALGAVIGGILMVAVVGGAWLLVLVSFAALLAALRR